MLAVIDIGTSSVRMAIAEVRDDDDERGRGEPHILEALSNGLSLGKDTFTTGGIARDTTEDCVRVLKKYQAKLAEYGLTDPAAVRVVATSAVREAVNRLAFIDRLYIATGLAVEPIDEAEVHRIIYRGVRPQLSGELLRGRTLVAEVGGGSTELLQLDQGEVEAARSVRLGALRLREQLLPIAQGSQRYIELMRTKIRGYFDDLHSTLDLTPRNRRRTDPPDAEAATQPDDSLLALGGDMRFAVREINGEWDGEGIAYVRLVKLQRLAETILHISEDEIVRRYRRTYPEAETLGPALFAVVELAKRLKVREVAVSGVNLRDGLLREIASGQVWGPNFRRQVIRSAIELGRRYDFDEAHATHIAKLASQLFDALADRHRMDERAGVILQVAALLHEVGRFVATSSYHKHSMYLIANSEVFGFSPTDAQLAGLVARYHRRATPKPTHAGYGTLDRDGRAAVMKMAALLRIARALDVANDQRVRRVTCQVDGKRLVIEAAGVRDLSAERLDLASASGLFEQTFGLSVLLRGGAR